MSHHRAITKWNLLPLTEPARRLGQPPQVGWRTGCAGSSNRRKPIADRQWVIADRRGLGSQRVKEAGPSRGPATSRRAGDGAPRPDFGCDFGAVAWHNAGITNGKHMKRLLLAWMTAVIVCQPGLRRRSDAVVQQTGQPGHERGVAHRQRQVRRPGLCRAETGTRCPQRNQPVDGHRNLHRGLCEDGGVPDAWRTARGPRTGCRRRRRSRTTGAPSTSRRPSTA